MEAFAPAQACQARTSSEGVVAVSVRTGSYGWRARIGMIKPSPVINTNAHEFYLMAPEGVELFVTSLGMQSMIQSEYDRVIDTMEAPLRAILSHAPDVILQAGVPPVVTRGAGFHRELEARVGEITDVPFFTDIGTSVLALTMLGCRRVAMVSHNEGGDLGEQIAGYLRHEGIEVVGAGLIEDDCAIPASRLPLEEVYRTTRRAFEACRGLADGVWITQASTPSVAVIDALEADLGCPVVSSAQALMWAGLRAAGVGEAVEGFGRLLRMTELAPTRRSGAGPSAGRTGR